MTDAIEQRAPTPDPRVLSALGSVLTLVNLKKLLADPVEAEVKVRTLQNCPYENVIAQLGKTLVLRIKPQYCTLDKLNNDLLPLVFRAKNNQYYILAKRMETQALIQDPLNGQIKLVSYAELVDSWDNEILVISHADGLDNKPRFDIRWFIPEFVRHRRLLGDVLVVSFFLQLLALLSPLFFQVVMDKVLVHHALATLDVLVIALVAAGILEVILKGLREYLFAHTTNRIDAKLGSKLFLHLMQLPLAYFKSTSVGITVMRISELSSVREFITGAAITLTIDLFFTFVFFAVMFFYSPQLTSLVLLSVPCYITLSIYISRPLRKRIERQFQAGAMNNAFLTESISGAETIKALAVEPQLQRRWESQTEEFVEAGYETHKLQAIAGQGVQLIQKLTMVGVLWAGATMVIDLQLTIGQFIAFNMMANHVSQPIIRLAELWQQFVQAQVSVDRLGQVLNIPTEQAGQQKNLKQALQGHIQLQKVAFRYRPDLPFVLNDINLHISAGEVVGIIGPSGSGKSTLTKLIQRLYFPQNGQVLIDGHNVRDLSPQNLRGQIGVVLQENYLFRRSVRDNIALADPAVAQQAVIDAAKLAGAHEFILELPDGYDTLIEEGGQSLSGGQRQRLAIARALLGQPSVLIFDEATSALDDHSQAIIQHNMASICQGRTVIIIAHRLSTVRQCNRIISMQNGRIVENGSHEQLLKAKGLYASLWQQQTKFQHDKTDMAKL